MTFARIGAVLVGAAVTVAVLAPAAPASAETTPCWKIHTRDHLLYDGPPGPDVYVPVVTGADLSGCL